MNHRQPLADPAHWPLDSRVTFLNHGSFGSCPHRILDHQTEWRGKLERQPVQFFVRELEPLLDDARKKLCSFLGAHPDNLVFVPNATTGINTVLRSIAFRPGDELLVTNHEYNACRNALNRVGDQTGATVVEANIPFPLESTEAIVAAVLNRVSARTRLVLIDHVTSQTGLIFPVATLIAELKKRGVDTLVDGAHAPGMVPLKLEEMAPAFYTGNCHKWLCAPKGAAFLYVAAEQQSKIRPLVISHGANSPRRDRSRFLIEFGWTGTPDPTAYLSVTKAIDFMSGLLPGGWPQVMEANHSLVVAGRSVVEKALGIESAAPPEFLGSLASILIPGHAETSSPLYGDPLQERLWNEFQIEAPVIPWPVSPAGDMGRILRISAQLYNSLPQYERLAAALKKCLR